MMLKSKLAAFAGALILAGSAFANQQIVCPDINEIKAEGLDRVESIHQDNDTMFLTYHFSNYNTPDMYGFFIAPVEGSTAEEALQKANEILTNISGEGVPTQDHGIMLCVYHSGHQDILAAAMKANLSISPMQLKQHFLQSHKAH